MAAKKRNSATEEEIEFEAEAGTSYDSVKPLKKKKKAKRDGQEESLDGSSMPSSTPSSDKPMEKRKKRKALDKERRRSALETEGSKPVQTKGELKTDTEIDGSSVSISEVLPEFHIGVFKDLASADGSVREAATETLARELQEVQSAYDRLERKELVEGGLKLEAEKDDGLDICAPSLRYAVRRLIRGVSSSREVCLLLDTEYQDSIHT